jgi:hypothetical protein
MHGSRTGSDAEPRQGCVKSRANWKTEPIRSFVIRAAVKGSAMRTRIASVGLPCRRRFAPHADMLDMDDVARAVHQLPQPPPRAL